MRLPSSVLAALAIVSISSGAAFAQSLPGAKPATPPGEVRPSQTFPEGARIGYVDLNRVAALSNEGKAAAAKLEEIRKKKAAEINDRGKQVESLQQKVTQGSTMLSEAALGRLQREFERAQVDFQRFREDAEAEVQDVQQQLLRAFTSRLFPVIGEVATEKNLWAVFSNESNLLWHQPALDLSEEIARRLDKPATPKQ
jgi:outer membrane protein